MIPENPPNCPSDAVIYNNTFTPWLGGQKIAGAFWIWRGDVSPSQLGDFQAVLFEEAFDVGANPSGTIEIAVDDLAQVFVNGVSAGSTGSTTVYSAASAAQSIAVTFDLTPFLREGVNIIAIAAQNGPPSFAIDFNCASQGCTYSQNPAGVVFAGTLRW